MFSYLIICKRCDMIAFMYNWMATVIFIMVYGGLDWCCLANVFLRTSIASMDSLLAFNHDDWIGDGQRVHQWLVRHSNSNLVQTYQNRNKQTIKRFLLFILFFLFLSFSIASSMEERGMNKWEIVSIRTTSICVSFRSFVKCGVCKLMT